MMDVCLHTVMELVHMVQGSIVEICVYSGDSTGLNLSAWLAVKWHVCRMKRLFVIWELGMCILRCEAYRK